LPTESTQLATIRAAFKKWLSAAERFKWSRPSCITYAAALEANPNLTVKTGPNQKHKKHFTHMNHIQ
jgi:hypothetical protein